MTIDRPEGIRTPSGGWFPPAKVTNPYEVGDPFIAFFNSYGAVVGLISADLAAILWYADTGSAAQGALIGYIAGKAGTDPFGNKFNQGTSLAGSGMTNPMTTVNDMIIGGTGGTPQRLPGPAADGLFLGRTSGTVGWYATGGGMTNPMTSPGDMIIGGTAGVPARLAAGPAGDVLGISGGVPTWITPATGAAVLPFKVLIPSGDQTGATDYSNFTAAQNALPNGGIIFLGPGAFYTNNSWVLKAQTTAGSLGGGPVCLWASPATVLYGVGTFLTGVINYHRTSGYGSQYDQSADPAAGFITGGLVIDGTYCTGNSIGLDVGDGRGWHIDVTCQNFAGTGQVGLQIINRIFWTEKSWFRAQLYHNTTAAVLTTAADPSHEYNEYELTIFCDQNQQGIVSDSVNNGGCRLTLRGNMCQTTATSGPPTGNVAALSIIKTYSGSSESRWYFGQIDMKVEGNQSSQYPTGVLPYGLYSDGTGIIKQCSGFIGHSLTDSAWNGAEFSFTGGIAGDTNLSQLYPTAAGGTSASQPAFPGFGVALQNTGPDQIVCIAGGGTTGIVINGIATGLTAGAFPVRAGASITVNGTGTPPATYAWIGATQMSY
jgi:hypothetical protein